MKRFASIAGSAMLCVVAFVAASFVAQEDGRAAARANGVTFVDPAGDATGSAADVTTVRAENDDFGVVTVRITLANRPQLLVNDRLTVYLDTDRDDRSGDANGADYYFVLQKTSAGTAVDLCRATGATPDCLTPSSTFRGSFTPSTQQVSFFVHRSQIGNTNGMGIVVRTYWGSDVSQTDRAPNPGQPEFVFPLVLSPTTVTATATATATTVTTVIESTSDSVPPAVKGVRLGPAKLNPAKPKAGGTLSASVSVKSRADGLAVRPSALACGGKVGGTKAPLVRKRTASGTASCTWRVSRNAKGKRFAGSLAVKGAGGSATRSFSVAIR